MRTQALKTERLVLRRARISDVVAMHMIMSDPQAMQYWSTLPHENVAQTAAWVESMIDADPADSDDFIMELEGQVIGKLGAWELPEVGFLLNRNYWGKGFAHEALVEFIEYMKKSGQSRLAADVDPENTASLKLLSKVGFVETGREKATYTLGDRIADSVYLALDLCG